MSSSLDHRKQFAVMSSISTLDISGLARPIGHRAGTHLDEVGTRLRQWRTQRNPFRLL